MKTVLKTAISIIIALVIVASVTIFFITKSGKPEDKETEPVAKVGMTLDELGDLLEEKDIFLTYAKND